MCAEIEATVENRCEFVSGGNSGAETGFCFRSGTQNGAEGFFYEMGSTVQYDVITQNPGTVLKTIQSGQIAC